MPVTWMNLSLSFRLVHTGGAGFNRRMIGSHTHCGF